MSSSQPSIFDRPAYGYPEAAAYVRLPYGTIKNWTSGAGLIVPCGPNNLSFNNLLELHILKSMRKVHNLSLQGVRKALKELGKHYQSDHPLLHQSFETDGIDLFIRNADESIINLSRSGQHAIRDIVQLYLHRIGRDAQGVATHLYPFVVTNTAKEPQHISISPKVSFGKSVLTGTGISTSVVAGRFAARDSISDLAREYGVSGKVIEDAIRWENPRLQAA